MQSSCDQCMIFAKQQWRFCPKCAKPLISELDLEMKTIEEFCKLTAHEGGDGMCTCERNGGVPPLDRFCWHAPPSDAEVYTPASIRCKRETPIWDLIIGKLVNITGVKPDCIELDSNIWTPLVKRQHLGSQVREPDVIDHCNYFMARMQQFTSRLFACSVRYRDDQDKTGSMVLIFTEKEVENAIEVFRNGTWYWDNCRFGTKLGWLDPTSWYSLTVILAIFRDVIADHYLKKTLGVGANEAPKKS